MKMLLKKASLYFHTLRYLKPIQIGARIQKKILQPRFKPVKTLALRQQPIQWQQVIQKTPSLIGPMRFRFLNEEHALDEIGWDDPKIAKLWRYNLHYFDDLNAQNAHERAAWHHDLIKRWIDENLPAKRSAWEPYTTSLRIVNWVKWLMVGNTAPADMMQSLADQAGWLSQNLEHHILGNHLFANAKALIFAGSFFQGEEAEHWLEVGLKILAHELDEQILGDGGHFELSPMYHMIILEDVLDIIQLGRVYKTVPEDTCKKMQYSAEQMLHWMDVMAHPDDQISFFNDTAFGIAAKNEHLRAYAQTLNIKNSKPLQPLEHLEESGYIRAHMGDWTALIDVARIGPDYLPGHAHADQLSFELSHGTKRIFVNSGISGYGLSPERHRQRGTAAHNTIELNGENSAEIWSGFRVARRGQPYGLSIDHNESSFEISSSHNGYKRLRGGPIHKRNWSISANEITIRDEIVGVYQSALSHLHFHPDTNITLDDDKKSGSIQCGKQLIKFEIEGGVALLETSTYHPEFGKTLNNQKLIVELSSPRLIFRLRLS